MNCYLIFEKGQRVPWLVQAAGPCEAVAEVLSILQENHGDNYCTGKLTVRYSGTL